MSGTFATPIPRSQSGKLLDAYGEAAAEFT